MNDADLVYQRRLDNLTKARLTRKTKPVLKIKTDYLDDAFWQKCAKLRDIRLPYKTTPATTSKIAPYLTKLGITYPWFKQWCGFTPAEWITHNPTFSLRALVGLLLEETTEGVEADD